MNKYLFIKHEKESKKKQVGKVMHITRITICVIFIYLKEFEGLNVGLCKQFIELPRWVNS
jgi:hypothetical protein